LLRHNDRGRFLSRFDLGLDFLGGEIGRDIENPFGPKVLGPISASGPALAAAKSPAQRALIAS
jgi:hypothetical protein